MSNSSSGEYFADRIDGRDAEPLVITEDFVLSGIHPGTVHVEGGHFILEGILQGTLDIQEDVTANIEGTQQGTINIGHNSVVTVTGAIQGTTNVERGATLIIEDGARLAGVLTNSGTVVLRGVFGGPRSGRGEFRIEGNGYVKQPTVKNGISYYNW